MLLRAEAVTKEKRRKSTAMALGMEASMEDDAAVEEPDDQDVALRGTKQLLVALDQLAYEVLGPPEERRAPHSRCAPVVVLRKPTPPGRIKLSQVVQETVNEIHLIENLISPKSSGRRTPGGRRTPKSSPQLAPTTPKLAPATPVLNPLWRLL